MSELRSEQRREKVVSKDFKESWEYRNFKAVITILEEARAKSDAILGRLNRWDAINHAPFTMSQPDSSTSPLIRYHAKGENHGGVISYGNYINTTYSIGLALSIAAYKEVDDLVNFLTRYNWLALKALEPSNATLLEASNYHSGSMYTSIMESFTVKYSKDHDAKNNCEHPFAINHLNFTKIEASGASVDMFAVSTALNAVNKLKSVLHIFSSNTSFTDKFEGILEDMLFHYKLSSSSGIEHQMEIEEDLGHLQLRSTIFKELITRLEAIETVQLKLIKSIQQ
ncbi:hypothetical protein VCHA53O466_50007 [Vibrio chagasii]|nr:hypothetical protein VCHA53O466_50007 [Vibrio chagasii]